LAMAAYEGGTGGSEEGRAASGKGTAAGSGHVAFHGGAASSIIAGCLGFSCGARFVGGGHDR